MKFHEYPFLLYASQGSSIYGNIESVWERERDAILCECVCLWLKDILLNCNNEIDDNRFIASNLHRLIERAKRIRNSMENGVCKIKQQ